MSSVARQGLITTLLTYLGIAIGYVNYLYLFPAYLSLEELGLFRLVQDMAILFTPLAHAGLAQGVIRYMPEFRLEEKKYASFVSAVFGAALLAFCIVGLLFWLFQAPLSAAYAQESPELPLYFGLVYGLIGLMAFTAITEAFYRGILRTVLPNLVREVGIRLFSTLALGLYIFRWIDFESLMYSLLLIYGLGLAILLFVLSRLKVFRLNFQLLQIPKQFYRHFFKYSLYMIPSASGLMMVGKIDFLMIGSFLGLKATGVYTIAFYIATIIEMPKRALAQLIMPLYARAFRRKHMHITARLYRESSLNQQLIAQLIFLGLVINLDPLFRLIPQGNEMEAGLWVVWIAGLAKVLDSAFGLNGELIVMSRYYRFILMAMLGLVLIAVASNLIFIPWLGLSGAALATFFTLSYYNLAKYWFIWRKFGFHAFSFNNLKALLLAAACYFLITWGIPPLTNPLIEILLRSLATLGVYWLLLRVFRLLPSLQDALKKLRV